MVEKAQQQRCGETGLHVSIVGKQREGEMMVLSLLSIHTVQSVEWYCPHLEWVFLFQTNQCRKSLRDMGRGLSLR